MTEHRRHQIAFAASAIALGTVVALLVGEGIARVYEHVSQPEDEQVDPPFFAHDPEIGAVLRPNAVARNWGPEFDTTVRINGQGMRMDHDVAVERTPGVRRILLLGDSFTFGHGVSIQDRFGDRLERALPDTEVLNLGVPGYGTDQQYLLYLREGVKYHADVVILCYFTANVWRNGHETLAVKGGRQPKPRFVLQDGDLVLTNTPVPEGMIPEEQIHGRTGGGSIGAIADAFRAHSALYRLSGVGPRIRAWLGARPVLFPEYDPDREEWKVTEALLGALADACRENGSRLLVMDIPTRNEVHMKFVTDTPFHMVGEACRKRGIPFLDLLPEFRRAVGTSDEPLYFPGDGHWTPAGHALAAGLLADFVTANAAPAPPGDGAGE